MAKKEYGVITSLHSALPRSKRRRNTPQTESGGGGGTVNVVSSGGSDCDAHTHSNKVVLDSLSMDDSGYAYLRHRTDEAEISVTEKIKAGYADDAEHARESDNATKWAQRNFDDYLDQSVRKNDGVQFLDVVTDTLRGTGQFVDGLLGSGYQLWKDDKGSNLTIDKLTVRQTMVVLELLIERIRSVGGQIVVSAANGKIKEVKALGGYYQISFEQDNLFIPHDLVRCQVFANGTIKGYWVEVDSVEGNSILIPVEEFNGTAPAEGDECVLMGNTRDTERQNLILISATEDGQPRIDVMDGVKSKSFDNCLRARFGHLSGISDDKFPSEKQPNGYGLYCDNAFLRGTFVLETGEDVKTRFEITEGKIQSAVTGLRQDFLGENGYLSNAGFADGMDKWTTENEAVFFLVGNKWVWVNDNVLTKKGNIANVTTDNGRVVVRINNKYILQEYSNLRAVPTMETTTEGLKTPLPVYLSFFYRCEKPGTLNVTFENVDMTDCVEFESFNVEEQLSATDDYKQYTCSGLWNGTGDFKLSFTGEIYLYMLVLSTDKVEALTYQYRTLFEQSEKLVNIAAQNFDKDGRVLAESGLMVKSTEAGIYTQDIDGNVAMIGTLVEVDTETGEKRSVIKLTADNIKLEGIITANGNFKVLEDGSVETISGRIGGWDVNESSISKGNVSLGADGSIANGNYWKLGNDGSGYLAKKSITWDKDGNSVFKGNLQATNGFVLGTEIIWSDDSTISKGTSVAVMNGSFKNVYMCEDANNGQQITIVNFASSSLTVHAAYGDSFLYKKGSFIRHETITINPYSGKTFVYFDDGDWVPISSESLNYA